MPQRRPNILFIVVDDCGYADLGCTGQTDYRTPSLDRLAAEGIRFTQAYANSALCTNTRVALITGRYQYRLPIGLVEPLRWSDREAPEMGVPPGFPTLPALLRGAGYRTALIGKWHLGYLPRYSPLKSGYDEFFGIMGGFTGYYTHMGDGGEHDLYEGETPVEAKWRIVRLGSGRFTGTGPMYGGAKFNIGPMALITDEDSGVSAVLAAKRIQANDKEMFRHVGVEPAEVPILVLKSTVHFRADFQPIAQEILCVRSPGAHVTDPAELSYKNLRPGIRLNPLRSSA